MPHQPYPPGYAGPQAGPAQGTQFTQFAGVPQPGLSGVQTAVHPGLHPGVAGWPQLPFAPRNGPGTAALVLGIVGASLCWTFVLSPLTLSLGVLALIFGFVGFGRARSGAATNRKAALGGLWTGAGTTLISLVLTVVLVIWGGASVEVETEAGSEYLAGQGEEVAFENGVRVTFDAPESAIDSDTVLLSLNVTNGGEDTAEVTADRFRIWIGDVRVGEADVVRSQAPGSLAPGATTRLSFTVTLVSRSGAIDVDYAPGDDYEWGYWEFDLPPSVAQGNGGGSGDPGDGGGADGGLDA
ncbi:hypothetical protein D7294_23315 [Streptomyces hoynatensis]|uniref:DUF4190 domain-containing protein n=1 Tax=Streptomyces hoynatensis TaxID=1141874 RepID=A0A3A9YRW9_9ACTN|nr:hypothetical protein D7294_23315 [Streptomyces hoynatensis]